MCKKILSVFFAFAMVFAMSGNLVPVADAQPTAEDYRVGYARVDINPYIVDGDIKSGIMLLPLRGSGDVWNRLSSKGLVDDNGDGKVNEEDGLKVTCIAVTDVNGKTILLITIDVIGGTMISKVRKEIMARVNAALESGELTDVQLAEDQIYYAGTHTHTAPDTTVYSSSGKTGTNNDGVSLQMINENLGIWINRTVEDIGDAAILALKDRAKATLQKDYISASQDTSSPVKGKVMNSVRHYYNYDKNGKLVCYGGDNFNTRGNYAKQVNQVNDNLYTLQFCFGADSGKTDIILANWRGHPSLNNSDSYTNGGRNCISSDYVGAFRHALEYGASVGTDGKATYKSQQVYRVAFFNGEGGNVNPRGYEKDADGNYVYKWIDDLAKQAKDSRGNVYGRVLAALAQHGLNSKSNRQSVSAGEISVLQYVYNADRKNNGYSDLAYEAAKAFQAASSPSTPFKYTNAAGETYVIASKFHANNITANWDPATQTSTGGFVDMELNVFMIGKDLAFVTVPGEPFDYYYNPDGSNAWKNLIGDTYGTPFVLGYCNGGKGYVPNVKAYEYETDATKYAIGSYESHTTPYAKGSGEKMIGYFEQMLQILEKGQTFDRAAYCQHCKTIVSWKYYNGSASLFTGHYYLVDDANCTQITIESEQIVCFDMNGYTLTGDKRAFYTASGAKATLNLMDSSTGKTGVVRGRGGKNGAAVGWGGATIMLDSTNTLNLNSGNLDQYESGYCMARNGGVIRSRGTVNIYGGTVRAGTASSFTGEYVASNAAKAVNAEGYGATIHSDGLLNIYGGTVENGTLRMVTGSVQVNSAGLAIYSQTVAEHPGKGICIYSTGTVTLGGNAKVGDIYLSGVSAKKLILDTTEKAFTGKVQLTYGTAPQLDELIATYQGDRGFTGSITLQGSKYQVTLDGGYLVVGAAPFALMDANGVYDSYETLSEALEAYADTSAAYIRIGKDVSEPVNVSQDLRLDLNGHVLAGDVTVSDGKTLYVMDSQTADFTILDDKGYGFVTGNITGNVQPAASYLQVTEEAGISFHKVDLQIVTMSFRPSAVGVYYTAPFAADEVVAPMVKSYGICLSVENAQAAKQMATGTFTVCTDFEAGAQGNRANGALLSGIMTPGGSSNKTNAELAIYGCAYLELEDGYVFGTPVALSLRQLVESIDLNWSGVSKTQRTAMMDFMDRYEAIICKWDIPNMYGAFKA